MAIKHVRFGELGKLAGLTRSRMHGILNEDSVVRPEERLRIARALSEILDTHVGVSDLWSLTAHLPDEEAVTIGLQLHAHNPQLAVAVSDLLKSADDIRALLELEGGDQAGASRQQQTAAKEAG